MVVTALQRKISLQMCNKFRLVAAHLQPSWPTDLLLPGAFHSVAVTAPQFKIGSEMWTKFKPLGAHLLGFWPMDL
jgi:hypothetical protein